MNYSIMQLVFLLIMKKNIILVRYFSRYISLNEKKHLNLKLQY